MKIAHQSPAGRAAAPAAVRDRECPLCETPAGQTCQDKPAGFHLARFQDAYTAGQLTKQYRAMTVAELVTVDPCAVIAAGVRPGAVRQRRQATPERNGPDGFGCDCGRRRPWPSRTEDVTCPDCGTVWEHDGVDLGSGARIKQQPACHYCGRTGQPLAPCCDRPEHEHQLACTDVEGCRDSLLAQLQEQNTLTRPEATLPDPDQADEDSENCPRCGAVSWGMTPDGRAECTRCLWTEPEPDGAR
jgi:hypothetical protein